MERESISGGAGKDDGLLREGGIRDGVIRINEQLRGVNEREDIPRCMGNSIKNGEEIIFFKARYQHDFGFSLDFLFIYLFSISD